ncbi:MAG: hypothetical protein M3Q07_14625, partial [Pseudobdellovibrionaceae bacterium]|nr:hypothetical protein [Pseudobdellovibrionaceae bacterium]
HEDALAVAPVQLILKDIGGKRISVLTPGPKGFEQTGRWTISKDDSEVADRFLQWLPTKLGYDAGVLNHKGEFILAALLNRKVELGQGLLLKDSAASWSLKRKEQKGTALLQMLKFDGEFAVFEVMLSKSELTQIPPGTKILLGQKKRLK